MSPNLKFDIKITGNPLVDGVILKMVGMFAGGLAINAAVWLKAHGFAPDSEILTQAIGGVMVGGLVLVAGWYKSKNDYAKAAQGGINLVLSGEAIAKDGSTIMNIGAPGSTPPMPVTPKTGVEIMKLATPAKAA